MSKKTGAKKKPHELGTLTLHNRTGIATSPVQASTQAEASRAAEISPDGQGSPLALVRNGYERKASPVGTMPPPATIRAVAGEVRGVVKGVKPTVLLDKLSERCAFERTGTRLYEGLLAKLEVRGSYEGGPTRDAVVAILQDELSHFQLLATTIASIGGDPTVMSPCADVSALASMGWTQVIADPRTTLAQALQTILLAELADNDGWDMLIDLCTQLGHDSLISDFEDAREAELEHLATVRGWLSAHNAMIAARQDTEKQRDVAQSAEE